MVFGNHFGVSFRIAATAFANNSAENSLELRLVGAHFCLEIAREQTTARVLFRRPPAAVAPRPMLAPMPTPVGMSLPGEERHGDEEDETVDDIHGHDCCTRGRSARILRVESLVPRQRKKIVPIRLMM